MYKRLVGISAFVLGFGIVASAQAQPGWRPGPGWDRDIDVHCTSPNYQQAFCQVDTGMGGGVAIVQQISKSPCIEGRTWGFNRGGVWVNQGCEAVFRVQRRWVEGPGPAPAVVGGPWKPGPGWNNKFGVNCGSPQFSYAFCAVDVGAHGRVSIRRRTSDAQCIQGRSWGWNRGGVWVDRGCSADFLIDRRW